MTTTITELKSWRSLKKVKYGDGGTIGAFGASSVALRGRRKV